MCATVHRVQTEERKKKNNQGCNTKDTAVGSGRELFLDQKKKKKKEEKKKEREKKHFWVLQSNLVPFLKKTKSHRWQFPYNLILFGS